MHGALCRPALLARVRRVGVATCFATPSPPPAPAQAVYNIISGLYPASEKEVVALAAMQFQAKFGPFNASSHRPGFLTKAIVEYVPAEHLLKGDKTVEAWVRAARARGRARTGRRRCGGGGGGGVCVYVGGWRGRGRGGR